MGNNLPNVLNENNLKNKHGSEIYRVTKVIGEVDVCERTRRHQETKKRVTTRDDEKDNVNGNNSFFQIGRDNK